jgi:hypothetical protein
MLTVHVTSVETFDVYNNSYIRYILAFYFMYATEKNVEGYVFLHYKLLESFVYIVFTGKQCFSENLKCLLDIVELRAGTSKVNLCSAVT